MKTAQQIERSYRIWSGSQEEQIAIRIHFSVAEQGPASIYVLGSRDESI